MTAMRTIIPFPSLRTMRDVGASTPGGAVIARFPPGNLATELATTMVDLPEGENISALIASMPRALAMHEDIAQLISAVHGRYR